MSVSSPSSKYLPTLSSQHSEGSESVSDELELLVNVYLEDMEVKKETERTVLTFHVKPSTADDENKQFVWLDLQFLLKKGYPHFKPDVAIVQSRGLSDAHLRSIQDDLNHLSGEKLGTPMLFNLVEHARGCLTDNNKPCGHCAVCQFTMEEDDVFVRTSCYHYFHRSCMAHYIRFFRQEQSRSAGTQQAKKLECPVCREPLPEDDTCVVGMENLSLAIGDPDNDFQFEVSKELRVWQAQMAAMLRRQCEKGGTIVPAQEVVIDDTWVSIRAVKEEPQAGHHDVARSNREDNRPYTDDRRQTKKDPGVQVQIQGNPEVHRSREGSRDSLSSEQQGQSRGSNPRRLGCPPGFHEPHTGHEDSRRDGGRGSRDHYSDREHSTRGGEGSKGHSGGRQRNRGGTSRHGDREHGRSRADREAGGSHGGRERGRQGVHSHTADPATQHDKEEDDIEPNLRQVLNPKDKVHLRGLQEVDRTQENLSEVGHHVTKVTRQGAELRDRAKPHPHDSRRAHHHHHYPHYPHYPKKADGKGQVQPGGVMADATVVVLPCTHTTEQSECQ